MAGPIDAVYVDGSAVPKSSVRSDDKGGHRRNMVDVTAVRNADLTAQLAGIYIRSLQRPFDLDTTDTTTADDGAYCIVDFASNRFKRIECREVLTAARAYYVRADGSDANNGLANTAGGAFLTLQKAWNVASSLDASIYGITINIGAGVSFAGVVIDRMPLGGTGVTISGAGSASTTLTSTGRLIDIRVPCVLTLQNMKVTTTGAIFNADCIITSAPAQVTMGADMEYGPSAGNHMRISGNAHVFIAANYKISGSTSASASHVATDQGGLVEGYAITVTITGTPTINPFVAAQLGSSQLWYAYTFSGAVVGSRYYAYLNGQIQSFGANPATYFPGNSAGTTSTGGQLT